MEETNKNWYDKHYKHLLIIPTVLLIFSLIYLAYFVSVNGDIVYKDVSLTGGTTITVFDSTASLVEVHNYLKPQFEDVIVRGISDLRTGEQRAFFVETASEAPEVKAALENFLGYELTTDNSSIEFTGASISEGFYAQLRLAIIVAFACMALVVFLIFRTPIPSIAVILCAFADIVMTIAVINLFNIHLSGGGIVALLMLIGYSVDTDILLTSRVIKHSGQTTINSRIWSAFITGITMTLTALAAVLVSLAIIYSFSDTLRQIFTVLLIGLLFDIFNTWITNASLIKWYAEVKRL